jgi:hypothetical protein
MLLKDSSSIVVAAIVQSHQMIIAVQERLQDNDVTLLLYMLANSMESCSTQELTTEKAKPRLKKGKKESA